ncbi:MAG TPA: hypothetical protein VGE02_01720 [Gemmatimonadales bacterium]
MKLLLQLESIERSGGDGTVSLPGGGAVDVTSLDKVFFPGHGWTKGDLMRHYARVAPLLLPRIADRPLVLERYPDGVEGKSFFQQNAPEDPPPAVRVETIRGADGEPQRRFVGGDLGTLLHIVQLGTISVDPWNARVGSLDRVDFAILDLDPGAGASFRDAVAVARLVREELDRRGLPGELKTSGKRGLHVHVPLDGGASEGEALALSREIAEAVVSADPAIATVERSVKDRPKGTIYVDYLQNIVAKPVAAAWSVRATPDATVSTPLRWEELTDDLDPGRFTMETVVGRVEREVRG